MTATFDPYVDEDALPDIKPVNLDSLGNSEPPVLRAFSHIGKTFRQGGFCSPSPKRPTVKKNDISKIDKEAKSVKFIDLGEYGKTYFLILSEMLLFYFVNSSHSS